MSKKAERDELDAYLTGPKPKTTVLPPIDPAQSTGTMAGNNGNLLLVGPRLPKKPAWNGKYRRRLVRSHLVDDFEEVRPKLLDMARGTVKILIGFASAEEAAERHYEILARLETPSADRFPPWRSLEEARRRQLIGAMHVLRGGTYSQEELAVSVGVADQRNAMALMLQYGLGSQQSIVDEEGNTIPGVMILPPLEMSDVQARQRAQLKRLQAGDLGEPEDVELEYVTEDVNVLSDTDEADAPPPQFVDTISPELVRIVKMRRPGYSAGESDTDPTGEDADEE